MSESAELLRVKNLRKEFPVTRGTLFSRTVGTVTAVDGISFVIPAGKTLALVGESGCGKTTTARLILKLLEPTAGEMLLGGQEIQTLAGRELKRYRSMVQAVFQDPWSSLNPRLRVGKTIAESLIVQGRLGKRAALLRAEDALEEVGLRREHARHFPHEFSGGQRQRIAIASALVSEPKLIVLDEPVSSLDASIRSQVMNLFVDLQRRHNLSYLLITHDLATTRYMADVVAVMYLGKIVEMAETEALFRAPQHPYTKALFSAALPAHPDSAKEEIMLSGEVPSPIDVPTGCAFHPRCPAYIGDICRDVTPQLSATDENHQVSCHMYNTAFQASDETARKFTNTL